MFVLHLCDKIPDANILERRKVSLATISVHNRFGSVVRQHTMAEYVADLSVSIVWKVMSDTGGSQGPRIPFQGAHPVSIFLLLGPSS